MRVDMLNAKPEHYYRLSYLRSYRDRRLVVLWMMGRIPGRPTKCRVCGELAKTGEHLMTCGQRADIDRLGREMAFRVMVEHIRPTLDSCLTGFDKL